MNKKILLVVLLGAGCTTVAGSALGPVAAQAAKTAFMTKDTLMTMAGLGIGGIFYNHLTNTIAQIMPNVFKGIYAMQMSLMKKSALLLGPAVIIGTISAVEYHCYRISKNRLRI